MFSECKPHLEDHVVLHRELSGEVPQVALAGGQSPLEVLLSVCEVSLAPGQRVQILLQSPVEGTSLGGEERFPHRPVERHMGIQSGQVVHGGLGGSALSFGGGEASLDDLQVTDIACDLFLKLNGLRGC